MPHEKDHAERPRDDSLDKDPLGTKPGGEDDGGESTLSGRSREHHPAVPDEVEEELDDVDR